MPGILETDGVVVARIGLQPLEHHPRRVVVLEPSLDPVRTFGQPLRVGAVEHEELRRLVGACPDADTALGGLSEHRAMGDFTTAGGLRYADEPGEYRSVVRLRQRLRGDGRQRRNGDAQRKESDRQSRYEMHCLFPLCRGDVLIDLEHFAVLCLDLL